MKYTITEGQYDAAILADELIAAFGTAYGLSTAGTELTLYDVPDEAAVVAIIDAHVARTEIREANKVILKQIIDLEAKITPRRIRESLVDATWMKALDAEIWILRGQLQ